jgi:hypothetical protein
MASLQTRPHGTSPAHRFEPAADEPPGELRAAPLPPRCWIPPVGAPRQDFHLRSQRHAWRTSARPTDSLRGASVRDATVTADTDHRLSLRVDRGMGSGQLRPYDPLAVCPRQLARHFDAAFLSSQAGPRPTARVSAHRVSRASFIARIADHERRVGLARCEHKTQARALAAAAAARIWELQRLSSRHRAGHDLLDHVGLGIRILLPVLPVARRQLAFGADIEVAVGSVGAKPIPEPHHPIGL